MNDEPDDHLSSPDTCEHKGQHYYCIRDGIVSEAAWAAAPVRIIYVLKQPKEKRSLIVGANEKADDVEQGKLHQKNLWQNLIRWSTVARSCARGEVPPSYAEVKNVAGPSQRFADALRGCALFNLDDTFPIDGKRRPVADPQFRAMAEARSLQKIPRILATMESPSGGSARAPVVTVCCGSGVAKLFRQLLEKITRKRPILTPRSAFRFVCRRHKYGTRCWTGGIRLVVVPASRCSTISVNVAIRCSARNERVASRVGTAYLV